MTTSEYLELLSTVTRYVKNEWGEEPFLYRQCNKAPWLTLGWDGGWYWLAIDPLPNMPWFVLGSAYPERPRSYIGKDPDAMLQKLYRLRSDRWGPYA